MGWLSKTIGIITLYTALQFGGNALAQDYKINKDINGNNSTIEVTLDNYTVQDKDIPWNVAKQMGLPEKLIPGVIKGWQKANPDSFGKEERDIYKTIDCELVDGKDGLNDIWHTGDVINTKITIPYQEVHIEDCGEKNTTVTVNPSPGQPQPTLENKVEKENINHIPTNRDYTDYTTLTPGNIIKQKENVNTTIIGNNNVINTTQENYIELNNIEPITNERTYTISEIIPGVVIEQDADIDTTIIGDNNTVNNVVENNNITNIYGEPITYETKTQEVVEIKKEKLDNYQFTSEDFNKSFSIKTGGGSVSMANTSAAGHETDNDYSTRIFAIDYESATPFTKFELKVANTGGKLSGNEAINAYNSFEDLEATSLSINRKTKGKDSGFGWNAGIDWVTVKENCLGNVVAKHETIKPTIGINYTTGNFNNEFNSFGLNVDYEQTKTTNNMFWTQDVANYQEASIRLNLEGRKNLGNNLWFDHNSNIGYSTDISGGEYPTTNGTFFNTNLRLTKMLGDHWGLFIEGDFSYNKTKFKNEEPATQSYTIDTSEVLGNTILFGGTYRF